MELIGNILHLFFDKVLWNAVFPTTIIFLVFTFFNLKTFKLNSQFCFVLSALIIIVVVRLVFGVAFGGGVEGGWDCESRRYYSMGALLTLFSVVGFPVLVKQTKNILEKFFKKKNFTTKQAIVFFLIFIGTVCIGKALSTPSYKAYLHELGIIIKTNTPNNRKPLLIYGNNISWRERYHSNAEKCIHISAVLNNAKPEYFYSALKTLKTKGYSPYIFVDNTDNIFENIFINKDIKFKLKLLKELKNGLFSLYEY